MATPLAWNDQGEASNWLNVALSILTARPTATMDDAAKIADQFTLATRDRRSQLLVPPAGAIRSGH